MIHQANVRVTCDRELCNTETTVTMGKREWNIGVEKVLIEQGWVFKHGRVYCTMLCCMLSPTKPD